MNSEYTSNNDGIITSPGKFEGEPSWLPDFWDRMLDGVGEDLDQCENCSYSTSCEMEDDIYSEPCGMPNKTALAVNQADRMLKGLENARSVTVWESDQGFVYHELDEYEVDTSDLGRNSLTGKLYKYSSIGCYPLFYLDSENSVLCADCANKADADPDELDKFKPVTCGANWEDPDLYCDHCGERIESAYADDDEENSTTS